MRYRKRRISEPERKWRERWRAWARALQAKYVGRPLRPSTKEELLRLEEPMLAVINNKGRIIDITDGLGAPWRPELDAAQWDFERGRLAARARHYQDLPTWNCVVISGPSYYKRRRHYRRRPEKSA